MRKAFNNAISSIDKKVRPHLLKIDERCIMSLVAICCVIGLLATIL